MASPAHTLADAQDRKFGRVEADTTGGHGIAAPPRSKPRRGKVRPRGGSSMAPGPATLWSARLDRFLTARGPASADPSGAELEYATIRALYDVEARLCPAVSRAATR